MRLTKNESAVLAGIFKDRARLAALYWTGNGIPYGAYRMRIGDARAGLVAVNLAEWIGRPLTPSDSVGFSRIYKRLEKKG